MTIRRALIVFVKAVLPNTLVSRLKQRFRPAGVHWCRVVMNRECDAFVDSLNTEAVTCLEISALGSRWAGRRWASYRATEYPEFDACLKPLPGEWDVIIAEQVLEHVIDPQRALDNIYAMLRSGGILIITTPFLIKYHPCPRDYSRWTEDGLREMIMRSGFSRVTTGAWGNRDCLLKDMTDDNEWTYYRHRRHSLKNDPRFPLVVWAFAHK
jgi:SAM-dependent methyltransferase